MRTTGVERGLARFPKTSSKVNAGGSASSQFFLLFLTQVTQWPSWHQRLPSPFLHRLFRQRLRKFHTHTEGAALSGRVGI